MPSIALILLIGGTGERFGAKQPKQFLTIDGKAIYQITLDTCLEIYPFDEVVIATHPDWLDLVQQANPECTVIAGGENRQASSHLALQEIQSEYVMIHDGVRPFLSKEIIQNHLDLIAEVEAIDTCLPATDTIVKGRDGLIESIPNRKSLYQGQTPQTFRTETIRTAHQRAIEKNQLNQTDDCRLVHEMGIEVHIALGAPENIKITTEFDYEVATLYYRKKRPTFQNNLPVESKCYLVAGGQGEIGQAICRAIEGRGGKTIVLTRAELADGKVAAKSLERIEATYGPVDGLINCMGSLQVEAVAELEIAEIEKMIYDNYTALVHTCRLAPLKKGGHIINIGSSSWARGRKNYAIYSSSKAAVINFTEGLAQERPDLYINALSPIRTNTAMRRRNFPKENPALLLPPKEIAAQVMRLLQSEVSGHHEEMKSLPLN